MNTMERLMNSEKHVNRFLDGLKDTRKI